MKIAVTGKGGVGKTTFAATLARMYGEEHKDVLAVDADPDANLGLALGFTEEELDAIIPITKMRKMIEERTMIDETTKFYRLNPKVSDLPDKYAREKNKVRLLLLGTVDTVGRGCVCPENVILKRLLSHLILRSDDIVVLDMEAGLEHLARGTTEGMDAFIVVIEPGERSIQTYRNVKKLAEQMGCRQTLVVANKIASPSDEDFVRSRIPAEDLLGFIHYNTDIMEADRSGRSPYDFSPSLLDEVGSIKHRIDARNAAAQ